MGSNENDKELHNVLFTFLQVIYKQRDNSVCNLSEHTLASQASGSTLLPEETAQHCNRWNIKGGRTVHQRLRECWPPKPRLYWPPFSEALPFRVLCYLFRELSTHGGLRSQYWPTKNAHIVIVTSCGASMMAEYAAIINYI